MSEIYETAEPQAAPLLEDRAEPAGPFLSVLVDCLDSRLEDIRALLLCLSKQEHQDFEVLVVVRSGGSIGRGAIAEATEHLLASARGRVVSTARADEDRAGALNSALAHIGGRYVAVLRSNDLVEPSWSATFAQLAGVAGGAVLRLETAARDDAPANAGALTSRELLPVQFEIPASIANFATPVGVFRDLGLRFDHELGPAAEWGVVAQATALCGLSGSPVVAVSTSASTSDADMAGGENFSEIASRFMAKLDAQPLLLPVGAAGKIQRICANEVALRQENARVHADVAALREENVKVHSQVSALQEENAQVHADVAARREENGKVHSQVSALREENLKVYSDIAVLREENARVHADITALLKENAEAQARADEVSQAFNEASSRLSAAREIAAAPQLQSFLASQVPGHAGAIGFADNSIAEERVFLSIITRTQGTRARTLRDMLLSLAGQSCQDFELLIVVHSADALARGGVDALVAEFPPTLCQRVRVLTCTRPGRAAPLNDAIEEAAGQYVVVLDDDDFVFGHYVETFRSLAQENPGAMLRAVCTRQDFELAPSTGSERLPRAKSWYHMVWPATYDAVAHLHANYTPFMSVAFPATIFRRLGFRFDETLSTTEDWQLTTRAAMLCGVATAPAVTSVYRWWLNGESSSFLHEPEVWHSNRQRIIEGLDSRPVLLPPGATSRIVRLIEEGHQLRGQLGGLAGRVEALEQSRAQLAEQSTDLTARNEQLTDLVDWTARRLLSKGLPVPWADANERLQGYSRMLLAELVSTRSWRWTKPFRLAGQLFRGGRRSRWNYKEGELTYAESARLIRKLRRSYSWRLTAPFREIGRLFRKG